MGLDKSGVIFREEKSSASIQVGRYMGRKHLLEKDLGVDISNKLDRSSLEELKQSGLP